MLPKLIKNKTLKSAPLPFFSPRELKLTIECISLESISGVVSIFPYACHFVLPQQDVFILGFFFSFSPKTQWH